MTVRKSINLLPGIFQTDVNQKFLSATVDQLISEPNLKKTNGYIGRTFAPTYKANDSYIIEENANRQNYQLEPSILARNEQGEITFFANYIDLLNKIKYYGGLIDNHSRLFDNEYYTFDPSISFDKFVNFSQYYWLPDGPAAVSVNTSGVDLVKDYTVIRNVNTGKYEFANGTLTVGTLLLARGGTYTFTVNQLGIPFWIQIEPGVDGRLNATSTISTREVLGVTNNGIDVGTITFNVPQSTAQDRFLQMTTVAEVDYAAPLAYSSLHNNLLSNFLAANPQYAGITGQLDGKLVIFVDVEVLNNQGNEAWTAPSPTGIPNPEIEISDGGTIVPEDQRYGVWQVLYFDSGIEGDPLIRLAPVQDVSIDEKVFIKYGVLNASREFYKDVDGFFKRMPVLTSIQNELYYQDGISNSIYGKFKLVDPINVIIDVEADIIGQPVYTSPNGVKFTSGLKIRFGSDVVPAAYQNKEWYVENVGDRIRLVDPTWLVRPEAYNDELALNYPNEVFPEYITIKRDALDVNAWARNNRWFHRDIITVTAEYNNTQPVFDQKLRAQRPIVQFEGDYQLFNNGRIGKKPIDILDTTTLDPFNDLEGKVYSTAFGIELYNGLRVLFANATDTLVRDKIYEINLVQYDADPVTGLPIGEFYISLRIADDGDSEIWDTVVVTNGNYKGSQWWYDGLQWKESQQKQHLQQDPLYDIFDTTGKSLSEYNRSSFAGTQLFGYLRKATGINDTVLGFPLSYRNFGTQGDIEFKNYFDTDTFSFVEGQNTISDLSIAEYGFARKILSRYEVVARNNWVKAVSNSKQYQIITYLYTVGDNPRELDIEPNLAVANEGVPLIKVFKNNVYLKSNEYQLVGKELTILTSLEVNDKIDVLIYSDQISSQGYYEVPDNLNLNAQNLSLDTLTLGQLRNHLVELSQNSVEIEGDILGFSNLRDVEIKNKGGTILQHSSPMPYSAIFLIDESANFINSLRLAQLEYSKFKNKFLELSATLPGIDSTNPVASVDLILININAIKNRSFPWFYSDMVPYGTLKNTITYTVFNPLTKSYEITNVFNNKVLSNVAVLVYLNGLQLTSGLDYVFDTDRPAVTLLDNIPLAVDDVISIVEYQDTDGNYIPETPTKLGLYPRFAPRKFFDNTYRSEIEVLQGHDGSITPCFGDYRDDFLLELEKRIYNNIKLPDEVGFDDLYAVLPGKFRSGDYSLAESKQLLSKNFQSWIGNNRLDFSTNTAFNSNDGFTWNYSQMLDRIDGESLPGGWRACYLYFYDTVRPHQTPWEMLGFTIKPDWWEGYYGPAPYTGGNRLLWEDLEAGRIIDGERAGIDAKFARPGLTSIIPVDQNGFLIAPANILAAGLNTKSAASSWAVGDIGPTEWAWRSSSDFPFAVQQALALAKPAKYFGLLANPALYKRNTELNQYLSKTNRHLKQDEIRYNGETHQDSIVRTAGYINWIAEYLINQGINPTTKITATLNNYQVNLAYKLSGFTDKQYIRVLAEQNSPTSTNDSVVVPDENYEVYLYKSTPVQKLVYSAVILEKTTNGYSVRGYNINDPYFTIIPSINNSNAYKITVLQSEGVVFRDYQNVKLTVPYGYEFTSQQQIVDFLISYERYLISQGFTFDDTDGDLGETRNFKLSVKEFLFWAQQGWKPGSILVMSPVADQLSALTVSAVTDGIADSQYGSKVLDQNFKLVKNNNYNVLRSPTEFKLTLTDPASVIGYVELDLVQYEHVLIFDNTTVFSDVIYKPELGNRQYRLKLIGQKTADWDGSLYAPGFIYNSNTVNAWVQGKDYLKGDLVEYKNQYYVALQNVVAKTDFDFNYWKQIGRDEIKTGLLPNFSTIAVQSQSSYDSYGYFQDEEQLKYSHGLIGFKPRQFLSDLGLNETTQIELYKGYIKQKGSRNAVNQLTNAVFNNLSSDIDYFEEWAVRIGEYGALDINPYVEIVLDERVYAVNPSTAEFVGSNDGDGVTSFNKLQLYKSTEQFDGVIATNRADDSDYDSDILVAGYVNIDDVEATIFSLRDYTELNSQIDNIGSGYKIWCAQDFTEDWNVFRVSETNNSVTGISNSLDSYITVNTAKPHGLTVGDIFLVKGFDTAFDGFYQVYAVESLNSIVAEFTGSEADYNNLTTLSGSGLFFTLDSMRFKYIEDARIYGLTKPLHGWKDTDKIWIDLDAPTSFVQGQPVETGNNLWKVYAKQFPWNVDQTLDKGGNNYTTNDGFGTSVRMSADALTTIVGSPYATTQPGWNIGAPTVTGLVDTFDKNKDDTFQQGFSLLPDVIDTYEFGYTVDIATELFAVAAPGSDSDRGYVYVYNRPSGVSTINKSQIIVGPNAAGRFGSSISFDEVGRWLYVGAPAEDRVYVYGLTPGVSSQRQIQAVNDEIILTLTGNLEVNVGDVLIQTVTNGIVTVVEVNGNVANVKVNSETNLISFDSEEIIANVTVSANINVFPGDYISQISSGANCQVRYGQSSDKSVFYGQYIGINTFDLIGNISVNGVEQIVSTFFPGNVAYSNVGITPTTVSSANILLQANVGGALAPPVDTGLYLDVISSRSITNSIELDFVPEVPAEGLLISTYNRTFAPEIDYTLTGNVVSFLTGNLVQGTYEIQQNPYYALVTTIAGPAGSDFGFAIDSSLDGAQLGVGAPEDTVNVATTTDGITTYRNVIGAGSVYVYDRVIEAFKSTGGVDYITNNPIGDVYRVTIDEVETTDYFVVSTNTIRFRNAPPIGKVIYVETNEFNLLEKLIGVDSLEGGLGAIQTDAHFGTSLTICSNNCAIYVGAPNYDNGSVYNTGAVWKFHNKGRLYGTNRGYTTNPTFTAGDSIRLDNFEVTLTGTTLDSFIDDINNSGILGVSAVKEFSPTDPTAAYLRLNSDKTVAKNLLRILSGNGTVLEDAGLIVFAFMQIIVPPFNNESEHFGTKVILANNAYQLVISSDRGTTRSYAVFDNNVTVFDDRSTVMFDSIPKSGSVYVYELYDDPRDAVEDPGRYQYAQQLNSGNLDTGDRFGAAIDIVGGYIVASAPADDTVTFIELSMPVTVISGDIITLRDTTVDEPYFAAYAVFGPATNATELRVTQLTREQLVSGVRYKININDVEQDIYITNIINDTGSVYIFRNPDQRRGWNLIRYQEPRVDINSINRIYLYNNLTNSILTNMEFIDPAKGKILGQAEQEINYKTPYDPAYYNRGTGAQGNVSSTLYWNERQVGQVWWNLDRVRFIDYEQSSLTYRSVNWGRLFPGSEIEVCEWVESSVLPSQYVAAGFNGVPKYIDNSAYVDVTFVDPITGIITSKYYYWVKDKNTVDGNLLFRRLPIATVKNLIENPKGQGIAYAAIIQNNVISLFNISSYLSAKNTILHIDYDLVRNDSIIHSEYELLQSGNPDSFIPTKIFNKLVDSLAGVDFRGSVIPDPRLSLADRYGINVRPRQSMFVNRLQALGDLVDYVNSVLIQKPIARQYDLNTLREQEPIPSVNLGLYDDRVITEIELTYINTADFAAGYKVLVENNTDQDGLWIIYELQEDKTWLASRVQTFKTDLYWDFVDWYAEGFDPTEQIEFVVDTLVDALKLPAAAGDEILVKVTNSADGGCNLLTVLDDGSFPVVGIENGTVQLKTSLSDYAGNELGFGNQGFSFKRYDQNPDIEIRSILAALRDDIFINELQGELNNLFFVMINYLFNEQKYVDWIFKTSFISVTQKLRSLIPYPNYIKDNQTYYLDYINEVKPYITKVREYLINYDGDDLYEGSITDFDLPPYYDTETGVFRSPSGEQIVKDSQLWATGFLNNTLVNQSYPQWYANRNQQVIEIVVVDPGSGYTYEPVVSIVGIDGDEIPATATARIDFDTGTVIAIDVISNGGGYAATPTVILNGGTTGREARAYAVLNNQQVRSVNTTLKFDRTGYTSNVIVWSENAPAISVGDIVSYGGIGYRALASVPAGAPFNFTHYEIYAAANFSNANDRILAYYNPSIDMPAKDLRQLVYGIEYPGVEVKGLAYDQQPGMSGASRANITFSSSLSVQVGDVISQPEADILLNLNLPITANIGDIITQTSTGANATVYGSEITSGTGGEVINSAVIYLVKNNSVEFTAGGNILVNGNEQVVSTYGNLVYIPDTNSYSNVAPYFWGNVGVYPLSSTVGPTTSVEVAIPDATVTVTRVWDNTTIEGKLTSTTDFVTGNLSLTKGNLFVNSIDSTVYPTQIEYTSTDSIRFDSITFDNIDYDEDGIAILSEDAVDTVIRSSYTDLSLGLRPEDINVDGGAYVDTYSSHAPEELVPGRTYDTLDIKVYTTVPLTPDTNIVLGYRIFENMLGETTFLRIAADYLTELARPLLNTDTEIFVVDASKLPTPNPTNAVPGVVFIGAERVTYYTIDLVNNTLGQLRRGTYGTACPEIHGTGQAVMDGGLDQIVPNSEITDLEISSTTSYLATTTPSYRLRLNTEIAASVGDIITQQSTGANVTVIGSDGTTDLLLVNYNNNNRFSFADAAIITNGNVTANVGDYVTQSTTGANLQVVTSSTGANIVARYLTSEKLDFGFSSGDIAVNGTPANVYPVTVGFIAPTNANLTIANNQIGSVFAVEIDSQGQNYSQGTTIAFNTESFSTLATANITINTTTGAIVDAVVTDGGNGYVTTTLVSIIKPNPVTANIIGFNSTTQIMTVDDTTGIYVGEFVTASNVSVSTQVTAIFTANSSVLLSSGNTGPVTGEVTFYDGGFGGQLVAQLGQYIHPLSSVLAGSIDSAGVVEIEVTTANVELRQANIWYELGDGGTAADGTGFEETDTVQVNFLRAHPASFTDRLPSLTNVLETEGAVNNRIITEDGKNQLIEES